MQRFALLLFAFVLTACAHSLAPTEDELLTKPVEIVAPVLDEELGALSLMDDGRWAYKIGKDAVEPEWDVGQVVGFGGVDEQRRHLFVILSKHPWGAFLQRLDAAPIATDRKGSLIPVTQFHRQVLRRWQFCAGKGDPTQHPCITESQAGRYDIYPTNGERVRLQNDDGDQILLPAHRIAQVHWSSLGPDLLGEVEGAWIAVPRASVGRPTHSIVVADPSCRGLRTESTQHTKVIVGEAPAKGGLYAAEAAAWSAGVDAFARCDGDVVEWIVPGLARRGWSRLDGNYVGPFLTAFSTTKLPKSTWSDALAWAGFLATGDLAAADFYAERVLRREGQSIANFGRDTMQASVESGRVESAVRQGSQGTSAAWNRENDPRWGLGMAAVEDALGLSREFAERQSTLQERAKRTSDDAVLAAIAWYKAIEDLNGPAGYSALESLNKALGDEQLKTLRPAMVWEAARLGHLNLNRAVDATSLDGDESAFLRAVFKTDAPLPCDESSGGSPSDECVLDVYGRRFLTAKLDDDLVPRLTRVGTARWAPGYSLRLPEVNSPALLVAMLSYAEDRQQVERGLVRFAVDCENSPGEALSLARERPGAAGAAWFLGPGHLAYCRGLSDLIEASREWISASREESVSRRAVSSRMVVAKMRTMNDGREMTPGAAFLAELAAPTASCERWNVALGVAHLRAGRADEANSFTETALACPTMNGSATRLAAFINFDRTRSVSASFEPEVRKAVELASRQIVPGDACIGSLPPTWVWAPIVSEEMEKFVESIQVEPVKEDAVMLATATRTLEGTATLRADLVKALAAGDAVEAQKLMTALESDFAAIGFTPGMKRAAFIREHLVGPTPAEGQSAKAPTKRDPRFAAWTDPIEYVKSDKADPKIALAAAFLAGEPASWSNLIEAIPEPDRGPICGLPEPKL